MALQKDFQAWPGRIANYYQITNIRIDLENRRLVITVKLYWDEASKNAGENPVKGFDLNWPDPAQPNIDIDTPRLRTAVQAILALSYQGFKGHSELTGAVDV
jgi:hypothetical protein